MKVEYKVRQRTVYYVTRYHETEGGNAGGSETKGEYDSPDVAFDVAYALAKAEHEQLGYPLGDMRIIYPSRPIADGSPYVGRDGQAVCMAG